MTDGGLHRIAAAQETPDGLSLGWRLHNYELPLALLHLGGPGRRNEPFVGRCSPHPIKTRSTNGANANSHRRALGIKLGYRLLHLPFGFALHAISFHTPSATIHAQARCSGRQLSGATGTSPLPSPRGP